MKLFAPHLKNLFINFCAAALLFCTAAVAFTSCNHSQSASSSSSQLTKKVKSGKGLMATGDYDRALDIFKEIAENDYSPDAYDEAWEAVDESIIQAMNVWQMTGRDEEAVAWLDSLRLNPSPLVSQRCMRELQAVEAYELMRVDRTEEARALMLHAMALPMYQPDDRRMMAQYSYAAAVFFTDKERSEDVIRWCKEAIEYSTRSGNPSGAEYCAALLGDVYRRQGKVAEALDVYEENLERVRKRGDANALVNSLNNLAQMYHEWGLQEEAINVAREAVGIIETVGVQHPTLKAETFTIMGCNGDHDPQEAIYWLQRADSICATMDYNMGREDVDLLLGNILVTFPDSVPAGLERLQRACDKSIEVKRPTAWYAMAQAMKKVGDNARQAAAIDSMEYWLLKVPEVARPDKAEIDAETMATQRTLLRSVIQYRHDQMERKNITDQMIARENWMKWIIALCILVVITLSVLLWLSMKHLRALRQLNQAEIEKDKLKQLAKEERKEYANKLNILSQTNALDELTPKTVKEMGIERFFDRFESLYPDFYNKLGVKLSTRERLLSMLIAIRFDPVDIVATLGISKESLKVSRYRLRRKLNIPEETTLNEYLHSLI